MRLVGFMSQPVARQDFAPALCLPCCLVALSISPSCQPLSGTPTPSMCTQVEQLWNVPETPAKLQADEQMGRRLKSQETIRSTSLKCEASGCST